MTSLLTSILQFPDARMKFLLTLPRRTRIVGLRSGNRVAQVFDFIGHVFNQDRDNISVEHLRNTSKFNHAQKSRFK